MGGSLSGKLDELGLDDILQIVSVSRKTGILTLKSRGREAVLQCRDGLVVRASSTGFQQSLGELMVQKGIVDSNTINSALTIQQQEGFRERLGVILHNRFKIDLQVVEMVVREQISNVVMTLFAWSEGSFDFAARDEIETVDAAYLDPMQLILEQGYSTEELAAEGARLQHELGHDQEPAAEPEQTVSPAPAKQRCALVVVDDDSATAQTISNAFSSDTVESFALTRSEEALIQVDGLYRIGRRPVVLIDLIMPRMDGSGVLGGLELLKLLRHNFPDLTVMLMTDFHHEDAERECAELGCDCILKPRRGNVDTEEFSDFLVLLRGALQKCQAEHLEG